jgi:hypothetical protein
MHLGPPSLTLRRDIRLHSNSEDSSRRSPRLWRSLLPSAKPGRRSRVGGGGWRWGQSAANLSLLNSLFQRENTGNFSNLGVFELEAGRESPRNPGPSSRIPWLFDQGNFTREQGKNSSIRERLIGFRVGSNPRQDLSLHPLTFASFSPPSVLARPAPAGYPARAIRGAKAG